MLFKNELNEKVKVRVCFPKSIWRTVKPNQVINLDKDVGVAAKFTPVGKEEEAVEDVTKLDDSWIVPGHAAKEIALASVPLPEPQDLPVADESVELLDPEALFTPENKEISESETEIITNEMMNAEDNKTSFFDALVAIKGIGTQTAKDIIEIYETKDELLLAISDNKPLPFRNDVESKLIEWCK